jgi:hypothetical protein
MSFLDTIREYFSMSEPPQPVFGLENKSPPHPNAAIYIGNHGYREGRLPENYWQTLNYIRGQKIMPSGYTGNVASGPDAHLQDFGPIDSQYRTNRLIYPDDINLPRQPWGPRNDYQRGWDSRELFVNGVQYPPRAPIEQSPRLVEKKRVIRMNTPAEKAAYLATQNERGFTMVGEPYTPVTDTRLAPRTMLSTERVPYYGDYRAGSIPPASGKPFMTAGQAARYVPHYLARPDVARDLMAKAGTAGNALGVAGIIADAYNRATSDYENPVTGETFSKKDVKELDGLNYANSDLETIAMFHPDNAENHPEITDAMRDKFFKKKKK